MKRTDFSWNLPPELEARLSYDSWGPQRTITEADHLLIVLHQPPTPNQRDREHIIFLRTPDGTLLCNGQPNGAEMLAKLMEDYRAVYQSCEEQYEETNDAKSILTLMERLNPLNRASTNLLATMESAREVHKRDRTLIGARDEANEISRAFDLLVIDAKNALDYQAAKSAEDQAAQATEMADAQHKLNILAAFTFPVMALATLFGMNLPSGLEEAPPTLFWASLGCGAVIGFLIKAWVLGRKVKLPK